MKRAPHSFSFLGREEELRQSKTPAHGIQLRRESEENQEGWESEKGGRRRAPTGEAERKSTRKRQVGHRQGGPLISAQKDWVEMQEVSLFERPEKVGKRDRRGNEAGLSGQRG